MSFFARSEGGRRVFVRGRAAAFACCGMLSCAAASQTPTANPARPTLTNPATLPPVGYVQLEQGYLGSLDSPETASQYGVNQTAKVAFSDRLMAEEQWQPWARSREADADVGSNASGDLLIGGQAVLYNAPTPEDEAEKSDVHRHIFVPSAIPTIAAAYLERVHSGTTPDVDLGGQARTAIFLFSGHSHLLRVHYDSNWIVSEQIGDSVDGSHSIRRAQFGETISVDRELGNPNLQISLEVYHFSQPLVHATATGKAAARADLLDGLFALSYSVQPNLVLDCGFSHGFTSTSTRWQSFAGFTYLLPRRLWPGRN